MQCPRCERQNSPGAHFASTLATRLRRAIVGAFTRRPTMFAIAVRLQALADRYRGDGFPSWYATDNLFSSRLQMEWSHRPIIDLAVATLAGQGGMFSTSGVAMARSCAPSVAPIPSSIPSASTARPGRSATRGCSCRSTPTTSFRETCARTLVPGLPAVATSSRCFRHPGCGKPARRARPFSWRESRSAATTFSSTRTVKGTWATRRAPWVSSSCRPGPASRRACAGCRVPLGWPRPADRPGTASFGGGQLRRRRTGMHAV